MKKSIAFILPIILLFSIILSACSSGNSSENGGISSTADSSETSVPPETGLSDSLPDDINLDGQTVAFYSNCYYPEFSLNFVDEMNGEVLNDARYEAEGAVENRLNVNIEETRGSKDVEAFNKELSALIASGDPTYDIASNMDRFMITDSIMGYFIPTSELKYVDLNAAYWNPEVTNRFSIGKKIYYTLTSFNLYSYKNTNCVYVNLDYANDLGIDPLYDTVHSGAWTYEKMNSLAIKGYADVNGNSKADEDDKYGYTSTDIYNIWINSVVGGGCCNDIMQKDKDDYFVYGVSDRLYNVLDYIYSFYNDASYAYTSKSVDLTKSNYLFCEGNLGQTELLRNTDFEYTILPIPKFDDTQDNYYCRTYDTYFTMVLASSTRADASGAVLEAYSCEAYNKILPSYIEVTLMDKYSRDKDTADMVGLIIDRRTISLAEAFMYSLYGNDQFYNAFITKGTMTAASTLDRLKNKTVANIDSFNEYYRSNNGK